MAEHLVKSALDWTLVRKFSNHTDTTSEDNHFSTFSTKCKYKKSETNSTCLFVCFQM